MRDDSQLELLASRRWGLFTREEAFQHGYDEAVVRRRLKAGRWHFAERRVYSVAGRLELWRQWAMAGLLSLGPSAVLSHLSAAYVWRLDEIAQPPRDKLEFIVDLDCHRTVQYGVVRRDAAPRFELHKQLRVTPLARTLIDIYPRLPEPVFEKALNSALLRWPAVLKSLVALAPERTLFPNGLQRLLDVRRGMKADSPLEVDVWRALREAPIPPPTLGLKVFDQAGRRIATLDFGWADLMVGVMCESKQWHSDPRAFERDRTQWNGMQAEGWLLFLITKRMFQTPGWLGPIIRAVLHRLDRGSPQGPNAH